MGTYRLPDLNYDYGALEPAMSGDILELHHSKHHAAYVKGANDTLDRIAEARDSGDFASLVGLEKTMAFNLSGHVLHSIFWENLSPDGGDRPDGELAAAIDEHLGGFEKFRAQLSAATTGVQGSGWGVLSWEPLGKRLIVEQVYDHHGNVGQGSVPLLAFDAWEHAYYLQYRNVRPDYVQRLWDLVNWNDVIARFDAARGTKLAMSMPPFEAAQLAAGVLAARHRGDLRDAESLLGSFPDEAAKTRGFHVLAELALSLVKAQTGQTMDELVQELSVQLAQAAQVLPPPHLDPGESGPGRMDP